MYNNNCNTCTKPHALMMGYMYVIPGASSLYVIMFMSIYFLRNL